jgi:predicted nucleic acid-binding protein
MQLPDINVLIYAHRQDAPEHDRCAAWLKALVEAPEPFAVAEIVLAGFLRIVKSQDLSAGDADANSLDILPRGGRMATSRLRRTKSHSLGHLCEVVQRDQGAFGRRCLFGGVGHRPWL